MEIKESHAQLTKLQTEYSDLGKIQSGGIHLWPIVRYNELERFKFQQYHLEKLPTRYNSSINPSRLIRKLYKLKLSWALKKALPKLPGSKRIGFLSLSTSYYSETVKEKKYNRHIDPYVEVIRRHDSEKKWVKIGHDKDQNMPKVHNSVSLPMEILGALSIYYRSDVSSEIPNLDDFKSSLDASGLGPLFDRSIADFNSFISKVPVAELILSRLNLSHLFVVCFYDLQVWPFVVAARRLGIKVIDIQHGKQGDIHHVYSHNTSIHEMINMFPNYFWNWGKPSARAIESCFDQEKDVPSCIVGGNLYAQQCMIHGFAPSYSGQEVFESKLSRYETIVMYCGEPIDKKVPDIVVEYARDNPDVLVLVRLHPAIKSRMNEFKAQLPFENSDVEIATLAPLYTILRSISCLITTWSSVCVEGLLFKVPTLLIHENGIDLYSNYIEKGYFQFCNDVNKMPRIIKDLTAYRDLISDDFIFMDSKVSEERLMQLIDE